MNFLKRDIDINILGTTYLVKTRAIGEDAGLDHNINGYCDYYSKEIVIKYDLAHDAKNDSCKKAFVMDVLKHELVHAFFFESGLSTYSDDEILVDWIAHNLIRMNNLAESLSNE